jgi:hypothetical protein
MVSLGVSGYFLEDEPFLWNMDDAVAKDLAGGAGPEG